jgi:hypothetical protein
MNILSGEAVSLLFRRWKNRERWTVTRSPGRRSDRLFTIDRKPDGELVATLDRAILSSADLSEICIFVSDAAEMRRRLEKHFAEDRT